MRRNWTIFRTVWVGCVLIFSFLGASWVQAADESDTAVWVSKVVSIQGIVLVKRSRDTEWQPVQLNDTLFVGDQIRLQANSRAGIRLSNDAMLRLDQNTTVILSEIETQTTFVYRLIKGAVHFFSHQSRSLRILTPFINGAVEGTEFLVRVDDDQTRIDLFEGRILAENEFGSLQMAAGESAAATAGRAPQRRILVRPRDSVQWALYYPPVLALGEDDGSSDIDACLELVDQGRISDAIARLEGLDPQVQDARFLVLRAALGLHVGRVVEAEADIRRALELNPANGDALALQAIIAVVQNRKADALRAAREAVRLAPRSASARIALSYALQADFDLTGALQAAQDAVTQAPGNYLAWSRLAELRLSVGELDRGVAAARKAVDLNPRTAHAHTILGFAHLTRIQTDKAREAFNTAIALDSAAPLPRLGLGLAVIRDGDLEQGRAQIEIAASLDPANSLIRSYLGKAYYEEKRKPLDEQQFEIAKALDPNDPTPWFYDAIRKQSLNRPVEALSDLQKSIELNDNRAVYRSRLLLDQDLAARSAGLGRIYQDLGFEALSLRQGWISLNNDPSNYSAHRLLADSYGAQPRHEIARVSELLQSQLLQPTNIRPIQPAFAESSLYLISSQSTFTPSYNTYNLLFDRNQASVIASGLWGSNETWGGEGIVSGIRDKLSMSAGYAGFTTDGFRINNDQEDHIVDVFGQYELNHKTSIQGEYRYRETRRGDTDLKFFSDDFDPNLHHEDEKDAMRLGIRHFLSPASAILGNFAYQDSDFICQTQESGNDVLTINDRKDSQLSYSGELGYIFHGANLNIVGGAGYFHIDDDNFTTTQRITSGFFLPLPPPLPSVYQGPTVETDESPVYNNIHHTNFYLYSSFNVTDKVRFTLGASGDFFDNSRREQDSGPWQETDFSRFNPKFGIAWMPLPGTTLRGAAFRVLKRTLVTDQTLEPTQVSGFNQFYDDLNATDAWNYGVAIDQKFTGSFFGGVQAMVRDMAVPLSIIGSDPQREYIEADWTEKLVQTYFYWTPHDWVSLSAQWIWERLEREKYVVFVKDMETSHFPFGIHFFHPCGLFAALKSTYVDQRGSFERLLQAGVFEDGEDSFWLVDASIGYRLPKRYGLVEIGVRNLFDEEFQYYNTDPENPRIQPDRSIVARMTCVFP